MPAGQLLTHSTSRNPVEQQAAFWAWLGPELTRAYAEEFLSRGYDSLELVARLSNADLSKLLGDCIPHNASPRHQALLKARVAGLNKIRRDKRAQDPFFGAASPMRGGSPTSAQVSASRSRSYHSHTSPSRNGYNGPLSTMNVAHDVLNQSNSGMGVPKITTRRSLAAGLERVQASSSHKFLCLGESTKLREGAMLTHADSIHTATDQRDFWRWLGPELGDAFGQWIIMNGWDCLPKIRGASNDTLAQMVQECMPANEGSSKDLQTTFVNKVVDAVFQYRRNHPERVPGVDVVVSNCDVAVTAPAHLEHAEKEASPRRMVEFLMDHHHTQSLTEDEEERRSVMDSRAEWSRRPESPPTPPLEDPGNSWRTDWKAAAYRAASQGERS